MKHSLHFAATNTNNYLTNIGTSAWRSIWSPFRQLMGMTILDHHFHYSFLLLFLLFSPLSQTFLIERLLISKNLFSESWQESPKTWCTPISKPCRLFWGPWLPFWILRPLIGRNTRSARIQKLIEQNLMGVPNNRGLDPFPDPVGHFGAWRPFWISRPLIGRNTRSARIKKLT